MSSISVSKGSSVISAAHCVVPGFPEGEREKKKKLNKVQWIFTTLSPEALRNKSETQMSPEED